MNMNMNKMDLAQKIIDGKIQNPDCEKVHVLVNDNKNLEQTLTKPASSITQLLL